ncbi:Proteasomal ubiquitin receptor ADRM1, partial [Galemys pyrenaicus]
DDDFSALFTSLCRGLMESSNKYLVEFQAGKMAIKGTTVTPHKQKGMLHIQLPHSFLLQRQDFWECRRLPDRLSRCMYHCSQQGFQAALLVDAEVQDRPEEALLQSYQVSKHPMIGTLGARGSAGQEFSTLAGERPPKPAGEHEPQMTSRLGALTRLGLPSLLAKHLQHILATMNKPSRSEGGQPVDLANVLTPEIIAPILANMDVGDVEHTDLALVPAGLGQPWPWGESPHVSVRLPTEHVEASNKGDAK